MTQREGRRRTETTRAPGMHWEIEDWGAIKSCDREDGLLLRVGSRVAARDSRAGGRDHWHTSLASAGAHASRHGTEMSSRALMQKGSHTGRLDWPSSMYGMKRSAT